MKKKKLFACGIVVGLISALGIQTFGAPAIEKITAYINHEFEFEFDSMRKAVPEGYHILVYEGRSYVPAKFVAENLGATVEWNEASKVISVKSPEPVIVTVPAVTVPKDDEKISEKPSKPDKDDYDYKMLPQTKEFDGFRASVVSYRTNTQNIGDCLNLTITNTEYPSIRLDQMKTILIADGKEYALSGKDAVNLDTKWFLYIPKNETVEGYLRLPGHLKDIKNLHVELTIEVINDFKTFNKVAVFDIAL